MRSARTRPRSEAVQAHARTTYLGLEEHEALLGLVAQFRFEEAVAGAPGRHLGHEALLGDFQGGDETLRVFLAARERLGCETLAGVLRLAGAMCDVLLVGGDVVRRS